MSICKRRLVPVPVSLSLYRFAATFKILGIESSCDDTGSAVVNNEGTVLGESLISQHDVIVRYGGVMPPVARDYHISNIQTVVQKALQEAKLSIRNIDAVAVTVKPGLAMSLVVGMNYGKKLCKTFSKPFIPVHHMEAHALTIRLTNQCLRFPYLTFLVSGGHCLLAIVEAVDKFTLLGQSVDDAPGEAFDKVARRIKAHNLPKYRNYCGGFAVEDLALVGNPYAFPFSEPLCNYKNCNFSFSGIKSQALRYIGREEEKFHCEPDGVIPTAGDLCASFQHSVTQHLCRRLQRAIEYVHLKKLLPEENRILVVSGGSACNKYMQRAFRIICRERGYELLIPPRNYCTDNGAMIAWNGVEKYRANIDICSGHAEVKKVRAQPKCELGTDFTEEVAKENLKCSWLQISEELHAAAPLPPPPLPLQSQ